MNTDSIWLAYVGLPYTTAAYYERALRKNYRILTIGPKPSEDLIKDWNLESIRDRIKAHDLDVSYTPNMAEIYRQYGDVFKPSLYLWIESSGGHFPTNLETLPCPKACIFIDSHVNLSYQLEWAKKFDYIFVAQLAYVDEFKTRGLNAHWLPLAADIEIHRPIDPIKKHAISMVGSIFEKSRRFDLVQKIRTKNELYTERCFLEDMARVYSQSKIVFNNAIKNDLNMRVFEALSTGTFLLTDLAKDSGQDILFIGNEDYGLYEDRELLAKVEYYLQHNDLREKIALRGQKLVYAAHQYIHRVDDMLGVIKGQKPSTFSPQELRVRSIKTVDQDIHVDQSASLDYAKPPVSFVVPVLDYSPASQFNIKTLLQDLELVNGEVIIVFNNEEVANQIKNHPRISHYAVLKNNVGVSRAWNIGLNISRTRYTFILNADLKVSGGAIDALLTQIQSLDKAAVVGPQGAFFDFEMLKDYFFLEKGSFNLPIKVDAVSGFFFLVDNELFNKYGLSFDNRYTPCYREEWDMGLQIRRAGLNCYAVPTVDYDHEWSGSIRSYKKIKYYNQEETPGEILERTGHAFQKKWREIALSQPPGFLDSGWKAFALGIIEDSLVNNNIQQALHISNLLISQFPQDYAVLAERAIVAYHEEKIDIALDFFKKSLEAKPDYQVALDNIELIQRRHF